jgi:glycosyltransferase involved in cell wall biosynthesis
MRIAYYNPLLNEPWGAGIHGQALLGSWKRQGHEVLCLPWAFVEDPAERRSRQNRFLWLPEAARKAGLDLRARWRARLSARDCRDQLGRFRPDVLIARRDRYDYLLDELLVETVLLLGEVNAVQSVELAKLTGRRLLPWETRREVQFLRACDLLVCVSRVVRQDVLNLGVPESRVLTIHNGVDVDTFSPAAPPDPSLEQWARRFSVVFAYCGTFGVTHDMETLAQAASQVGELVPTAGFLFIGPSAAEAAGFLPSSLAASRVLATGRIPHDRVPSALAVADVFWAAFRHDYGSPLKMFEYLAMGRPVILACIGPPADLILESEAGSVVARGDANGLAQLALEIAADPNGLAAVQGRNGRRWAENHASWDSVARRIVEAAQEHLL